MNIAWWFEDVCIAVERAKCRAIIGACNALLKLDRIVVNALTDAERTKVESEPLPSPE